MRYAVALRPLDGPPGPWSNYGTAKMTPPKFFANIIGSGFRFDSMVQKDLAKETEGTAADLLARFGQQLEATTHPAGPSSLVIDRVHS